MKKLILPAAILIAGASFLRADDVALVTFKYSGNKSLHQAVFGFYEGDAPQTVANFKKLARKGFYNGLTVHRAFPHTLIQTGDPLSAHKDRSKVGTGGPGYTLPPEIHRLHIKGAIAAARLPDKINLTRLSNGSQFYVCLTPIPSYDGKYTVFGQVLSGMDTLDEISMKSVDSNDNPVERIVIDSVKIIPREKLPKNLVTSVAAMPAPTKSAPVKPAPVKPAPVAPAPVKPAAIKPVPTTPAPATPAPVTTRHWWQIGKPAATPAPVTPAPVKHALAKPAPVTPAPVKPALIKPAAVKPAHPTPAPATPAPATPALVTTRHWWQIGKPAATPAPVTPAPVKHALAKPAPITPAPVKPASKKPALVKPAPSTPAPAAPAPVKTKPWWQVWKPAATPAPATPAPAKPALSKPTPAKTKPGKPASATPAPTTPPPATPAPAKTKPWWQIF